MGVDDLERHHGDDHGDGGGVGRADLQPSVLRLLPGSVREEDFELGLVVILRGTQRHVELEPCVGPGRLVLGDRRDGDVVGGLGGAGLGGDGVASADGEGGGGAGEREEKQGHNNLTLLWPKTAAEAQRSWKGDKQAKVGLRVQGLGF